MDADELYNWMAYDMLKDEKFKRKIDMQLSAAMSKEEYSKAVKAMFASIGAGGCR